MNRMMACLLLAFAAGNAAAQETQDTFEVSQIVVSATRVPLERSALAASVTIISGAELKQKGIRTMADALRTVPGAAVVQAGSYGAPASLFMRGGESDYVQVLIDGVQVNSPGELFDFSTLSLENIDRIEIVRGPVSVLYGSDAVTGIIQLFTRQGARANHVDVAAAGGSYKSGSFSGELSGGSARAAYGIGFSHFRTDGTYAFNNEHANTGVTGRVVFAPAAATDLSMTVRYNTGTFHYPTDGAGNLVDANQHHVADALAVGLEVAQRLGNRLEARAQLGFNRNDDAYHDAPDHAGDNAGFYAFFSDERFQRESADLRFNYSLGRGALVTVGGELDRQRERGWNRSESEYGPFDSNSRAERGNRAAFAQLVGAIARIDVQAGARIEKNDRFGNFVTYRGGVSVPLASGLRARATAGTGFKEPRFYEQFATGFVRGNPDLQPETSRSIEAGLEWSSRRSNVSATWFAQRFRNLIQYVGMPAGPEDPNYLNLAGARADGLELEAAHTRGPLSLQVALTVFDTEVTDGGTGEDPLFAAGETLIRRPDYTASLSAGYSHRRFGLAATVQHIAERDDLDFSAFPAGRVTLASYTRVDATASAAIGPAGLHATLKLENVLDAQFEEAFNFPARGRAVFLGLRYRL